MIKLSLYHLVIFDKLVDGSSYHPYVKVLSSEIKFLLIS